MNNSLILKREISGVLIVICYVVYITINNFITNSAVSNISTFAFLIVSILISFRIPKIYRGEQLIYIGLIFTAFGLHFSTDDMQLLIFGFSGALISIVGVRIRYIRVGKNIKQLYNWYL